MEEQDIKKLAHGTGITFVGGMFGAGFTYFTGVVVARLVGSELIGAYYLSLIWMQLLSSVSRLGFTDALLRFVPPERRRGRQGECLKIVKTTVGLGTLFSIVAGGVLYFVTPTIGAFLDFDPVLSSYLRWFFLVMPLHVLFVLLAMVLQSYQRMSQVVLARDITQPVSMFVFTVMFLLLGFEVQFGLIAGFAVSLILSIGLISRSVRAIAHGATGAGWMVLGPLFAFAVPAMLSDATHFLYRWTDTLLVSHLLELSDVGVYSAAIRTSLLLSLIPMAINAIYATLASGYYHNGEREKLERALQLSTRWCLGIGLPIVAIFILGSREILGLWGSAFAEEGATLAILAFAQLFGIPAGILAYTLVMCNRQKLELLNTLVMLGLVVVSNLILLPRLGLVGAAISLLIVNVIGMALRWRQVHDLIKVRPFNSSVVKPFLSVAVAGAVGFAAAIGSRTLLDLEAISIMGVLAYLVVLSALVGAVYVAGLAYLGFEDEDNVFVDMIRANLSLRWSGRNAS